MNGKIPHAKHRYHLFRLITVMLFFVICTGSLFAQERTITGSVVDKDGNPLPGVSIVIKGTTSGIITDINGKYTLKISDNTTVLHINYVGYVDQDITVGDQNEIKVILEESIREIDQVVVIGYGTQKKSDLTGSVASVSAKDIKAVPVARVDEALIGRAAGVNVSATSGMPGASRSITIRGINSINGSSPLVVIDGIPVVSNNPANQMNSISPNDIESIEVLKDAASTAIYGASGGNGVILITTKKGKEGKLTTSLNLYFGFQELSKKIDLMNTRQWNQFYTAKNKIPYIQSEDSLNRTFDWQDAVFDRAPIKNVELNIMGGSEKSQFSISANYLTQNGILKKTAYKKLLASINSSHALTKWMKFDEVVRFSYDRTTGPGEWQYQNVYNNFTTLPALTMAPFFTPYDANGNWTVPQGIGGRNPFTGIDRRSDMYSKNFGIHGNFGLVIEPLKGLAYTTRISGTVNNAESWAWMPFYDSWSEDQNLLSNLSQTWTKSYSWTFQNYLTYNTTIFNNHNVSAIIGMEASDWWDYFINGTRLDYSSSNPDMLYFENSNDKNTASQIIGGSGKEARSLGYFGRLNYNYMNMVLFQFNYRYDGNSNFGPNNRYGKFPSASLGFKFSELEAVKNLNLISFGKIRIGYGKTGQFPIKTYWPYSSSILNTGMMNYAFDGHTIVGGQGPVQVPNPDLKWETVITKNIGVDLGFMKDQLNISIDLFDKINQDMIQPKAEPSVAATYLIASGEQVAELGKTGIRYTFPLVNFGSVSNKGIETTLEFKRQIGDVKINLSGNFTYLKNKITDLATDSVIKGSVHDLQGITISTIGQPIGTFRGYQFDGIFRDGDPMVYNKKTKRYVFAEQPSYIDEKGDTNYARPFAKAGDAKWVDANKDGKWDTKDWVSLGSYNPKFVYGFNFAIEYKWFDFSVFFQGVYGNKIYNGLKRNLVDWQTMTNHSADFADRYHLPVEYNGQVIDPGNLNSNIPEMGGANWGTSSSLYVEDGSYLRLKNLTFGITLPQNLTKKVGLQRLRIYYTGKNLKTFTKYSGYDPEVSNNDDPTISGIDIAGYPQSKMHTFGINVEF